MRPWDTLSADEKRLFCRMAEVFAGFLSYTDAQIGRILDYLEDSGQLDNTIIVVISDNGASGEGGPNGSVNETKFFNGYIDTAEESMKFFDRLGGPQTYNHYPIGWAMAFNTPYKLFKRYASHEGGIADTAIISWPNGIAAHGEVRDNYINVCDITPTVYDLLGITPPATVRGIAQKPLEGVSFKVALDDPAAPTGKETQFYTMLGTRGIWNKGWFANTIHAATPAGWSHFDTDRWELFHIEADRSQCHDLAAEQTDKLEELKALWFSEAEKYNGLPLADLNILETMTRWRPYLVGDRSTYTYYPDTAQVGIGAAAELRGQSFAVLADVTVDTTGAEGVLFKQGGAHGGHVLFIQDGRLHYIYNFLGEEEQKLSSPGAVPLGRHVLGVRYARAGTVDNSHTPLGEATLYIDATAVASLLDVKAHPGTLHHRRRRLRSLHRARRALRRGARARVHDGGRLLPVHRDRPHAPRREHAEDLSARGQGDGAGRPGQHGRPADRSRGWSKFWNASGKACTARGAAAPRPNAKAGAPRGPAGVREESPGEKSGDERYDLWSSDAVPSFMPSLKFLIALPTPLPSCGSRLAPKISTTMTRMTSSSGNPRRPMVLLPLSRVYHFPRENCPYAALTTR